MRTGIRNMLIMGVLSLVVVVGLPSISHAQTSSATRTTLEQCRTTPSLPNCVSFDPAVNPILADQKATYSKVYGTTPKDSGANGTCLIYNVPGGGIASGCLKNGTFTIGETSAGAAGPTGDGTPNTVQTAAQGTIIAPQGGDPGDQCLFSYGINITNCIAGFIKKIALAFLFIAAFFAGFGGYLFNWIIYITVFQFGNLIGNNAGMLAAWGVLRDLGNILLLFGFIFMGISTILSLPGNEFTAKRALPTLIIFAILMNFSLFAAEAVIDTSNAFGTTFYRQAGAGFCSEGEDWYKCVTEEGIGGKIMEITGISAIFNRDPGDEDPALTGSETGQLIEILGLTIFAAVTAFVFFAAIFLFVTRAVVLAILMAVSPIGFAGMAIPPLHEMASDWWKQLLKQSFFAPIYILLILVSIKFMEGIIAALGAAAGSNSTGDIPTLASAFSQGGATNVSMVVNFLLITGFMLGSLIIAQRMGAAGASRATKFAGAAVFGTAGFVARRTVGTGANAVAKRIQGSTFAENRPGLARLIETPFKKVSESSLSFRGTATALGKGLHIDAGKPNKTAAHGFHGIEEKEKKAIEEFEKRTKPTKEQKGVATELEKELDDKRAQLEARRAKELEEVQKQRIKVEQARLKNDQASLDAERNILKEKIEAYENRNKEKEATDLQKEIGALQKRLGEWNAFADKAKRDAFLEGLHNQLYVPVLGAPEQHAAHEAADSIRRNGGKSKLEKALKDIQDAAEKKDENSAPEGDHGGDDHGGGGDHGGGDHGPKH